MTFFNNAQQKFFKLGLIVSIFVFLGKIISLGRELSFSYLYGSNIYAETFFFNFNIMNLFAGIFLNTIIFYLVPQFKKRISDSKISIFENDQILIFTFIGIAFQIFLALIFFLGFNFDLFKISDELKSSAQKNYLIFCASFPILVLTFVFTSLLTARNNHIGLFFESIPSLIIIISIFLIPYNDYLFSLAFMFGIFLQLLILNLYRKFPMEYFRKNLLKIRNIKLNNIFLQIFLLQIIFALPNIVDHFLVSSLQKRSLAHFTYANKIYSIVYSIIFLIISRTLITFFIDTKKIINKRFIGYILFSFSLGVIFSTFLWYNSNTITSLLFYRGNFTLLDLQEVSNLFKYFTFLIPFYLVIVIILTFFYGKQRFKIILRVCIITLVTKLVYLFLLDEITIIHIPLSTLTGFIFSTIFIFFELFKEIKIVGN